MTVDQPLPRGFVSWLPYLWSHVLFPGRPDVDSRVRLFSLLLVIILPAILLYPTRSFHLLEPDEGRYAQIAQWGSLRTRRVGRRPTLQGQV